VDGRCALEPNDDASPPPMADAGADTIVAAPTPPPMPTPDPCPTDPVDLLFVVDNSNSMSEEQVSLVAALPRLVEGLTSGDINGDGEPEFRPVTDIRVGVVTTDMGTGGYRVPTCLNSDFGDDAVLRTAGNTLAEGCAESYPPFLSWTSGDDDVAFIADATCVMNIGMGGCGYEQPLEAALKAATPSSTDLRFALGSRGQADRDNDGFFRDNAVLGVVVVTDEEDCSAADPALFDPSSPTYPGDLNLRCHDYGEEALHPIRRYVDGLLERRSVEDLVFAVIGGIPLDALPESGAPDYDAVLTHPQMQQTLDADRRFLEPSCDVPDRGRAYPPRRLVQVAQSLSLRGAATTVQSICQEDYTAALVSIAERVGTSASEFCE